MVNFLHRTSTFRVYETILKEMKVDADFLSKKMVQLGHKRKSSDINNMVSILEKFGLLEEKMMKLSTLLINGNAEEPTDALIFIADEFLNELLNRGLLVKPFLESVNNFPNKNKLIQYELVERCADYGFYDQRVGDDISAAMRNFTSLLNLTTPNPKRGQYELTNLGKLLLEKKKQTYNRVICDQGEPCRVACPSGAISAYIINTNCISCGLCVNSCPYGALSINCQASPQLHFSVQICQKSKGTPNIAQGCTLGKLLGEELTLQRWIKNIMAMYSISAEIPGIGEYPDLVTLETPSFIEVKKNRITKRKRTKLIEQITRYSQKEIIQSTIKQLNCFSKLKWKDPEYLVVISPKGGQERELLKDLRYEISEKKFGFVSVEKLHALSNSYFTQPKYERNKISLIDLFE